MRQFIKRALQKTDKLSTEQFRHLLVSSSREIDRLERVIDSLPRGIILCDRAHKLILANKSARRLLSISAPEQSRDPLWALLGTPEVVDFVQGALTKGGEGEEGEFDVDLSGTLQILSISVLPMTEDNEVSGSLVLIDDITERKSREARLHRMENLASLTTLAAGVAHEIKNPLASLSIHVQLIKKLMEKCRQEKADMTKEYIPRVDNYLEVVDEEIDRLNGIVLDFLFAVRPMNAELRRGNINALIHDLMLLTGPELEAQGIRVKLNLAEKLGPVDFDSALLKQALLNLITNAAAAMTGGGEISIFTEEAQGELQIGIADTGEGIPQEDLTKIFEPYYSTKAEGTGLGLTITYKIIKEHQGEIHVRSSLGEGTLFTICLPLANLSRPLIAYEPVLQTGGGK